MRCENWEKVLRDYIANSRQLDFEWGTTDCCLWVAEFVDIVTGTNRLGDWKGKYNTETGAMALMAERGFTCPSDIADSCLPRKKVTLASRGDLVSFEGGALGICDGRYSYFFVEGKGLCALPTLKCKEAWGV